MTTKRYQGRITVDGARRLGLPAGTAVEFELRPEGAFMRDVVSGGVFIGSQRVAGSVQFAVTPDDEPNDGPSIQPTEALPWEVQS